jgi:acetyl esterase/lipase
MMLSTALAALVSLALPPAALRADPPQTLDVWPGKPPGETGKVGEEKVTREKPGQKKLTLVTNVTRPTLTVYRPDKEKDTGAAVVICPGGGYHVLAWDLEGEEVARWLNSLGVTGILMKYRVPRRPDTKGPPPQALMDGQRAISLVRSKAKEWGLDPRRIGMLGFSAGGHLTAWTSTNFDKRCYEALDEVDRVSCRPDFAVLVYPWALHDRKAPDGLARDIRVTKESPPAFFAHAVDDFVSPENSVAMFQALRRAGVSAELHLYARGGHGFGLRPGERPCSTWPQRCADWLRDRGLLKRER